MHVLDGVAATERIHQQLPHCKILMLTTFNDEAYVVEALQVGASGYLLKDLPARDLTKAVLAVQRGVYKLEPAVMQQVRSVLALAKRAEQQAMSTSTELVNDSSGPHSLKHGDLTEREIEVLRLIAKWPRTGRLLRS